MERRPAMEPIGADNLVCEVLAYYPTTATVFVRHGLQCVGCYISPFHTIADSAREHAMVVDALLDDLNQAVAALEPGLHHFGSGTPQAVTRNQDSLD